MYFIYAVSESINMLQIKSNKVNLEDNVSNFLQCVLNDGNKITSIKYHIQHIYPLYLKVCTLCQWKAT